MHPRRRQQQRESSFNVHATQPIRLLPLAQYNYTFSRLVIQKGLF